MAYGDSQETAKARERLRQVGVEGLTDEEKLALGERGTQEYIRGIDDLTFRQKVSLIVKTELKRSIKRFTLTSAQILALNGTVVTLIPAFLQSVIIVEGIEARLNFNSIAYTGANALEFRYTGASGTKVTADMASTFINSASTAYDHVAGVVTELTPVINAPIVVRVPTANPGAGNSTLDLFIKFRIVSF